MGSTIDLTYDSKEWQPGEIREYDPISGGCFLCVRTKRDCKYRKFKAEPEAKTLSDQLYDMIVRWEDVYGMDEGWQG